MGSGKTTIGKHLADRIKWQFIDSDAMICEAAGIDIATIFARENESGFRKRETQAIKQAVRKKNIVMATGGGAILAEENRQLLKDNGVVIFLDPDLEIQLKHLIRNQGTRPLLKGSQDLRARLQTLNKQRHPLYEKTTDFTITLQSEQPAQIVDKIIPLISAATDV